MLAQTLKFDDIIIYKSNNLINNSSAFDQEIHSI
jgi:hypothetical protein